MGYPIDQKLVCQLPPWLIDTESSFNSARGPFKPPYIIQRRPKDPNGRFSVRLAQRQYTLVNTVTGLPGLTAHIRVIPRLAVFDQIRLQPMHDSLLLQLYLLVMLSFLIIAVSIPTTFSPKFETTIVWRFSTARFREDLRRVRPFVILTRVTPLLTSAPAPDADQTAFLARPIQPPPLPPPTLVLHPLFRPSPDLRRLPLQCVVTVARH